MNNSGDDEKISLIDWYYYWVYRFQLKISGLNDPHGWAFHAINVQIMVVLFAIGLVIQYDLIHGLGKQEYNLAMVLSVISLGYLVTYLLLGNEETRGRRVALVENQSDKKHKWLFFTVPIFMLSIAISILYWFFVWSK